MLNRPTYSYVYNRDYVSLSFNLTLKVYINVVHGDVSEKVQYYNSMFKFDV